MRIGLFTDTYLPDINGVVTSVDLLRKQLEKLGNEVYVICTHTDITGIKKEGNIIRLPGIEIKKMYGYALVSPIHLFFIDELKKLNLDIIHAETEFGVGIFANIVSSNLNIPLVRTYHTTYEDYTHYLNFLKSKHLDEGLKKIVASISKLYCNNCVRLITPSNKTANMLKNYGVNTQIDVIPTGIELDRFKKENTDKDTINKLRNEYGIKDDDMLLLFVGRIAEEKSIDSIIKAFVKVKENKLKIKLLIVGGGPSLEDLKELTNNLQLDDYIKFAGKKAFDDIPKYYHCSNAFISASTSETQGMTYIEALASGLIVLAAYDEVLDDLIIENKNGFFFNNEYEIYDKISKYSSLSDLQIKEMSQNALNSVKIYDANKFGEDTLRLYKDAIEDYEHSFIIDKTTLKDDYVVLDLRGFDDHKEKLTISIDNYSHLGFRKDSKLTKLNYTYLRARESEILAYKKCLKKLSIKDYSVKEIKTYLNTYFELDEYIINRIVDTLIEKGYIDDHKFAISKIDSFKSSFMSKKAIIKKLKKYGISDEIIDKCVLTNDDLELISAKKKAEKYMNSIKNKSLNAGKQYILNKLVYDGFSYEMAKDAIGVLDFSDKLISENELLKKEANKAFEKYKRKYEGTELRNKVYLSLVSKGFNYDNIYAIINEMGL